MGGVGGGAGAGLSEAPVARDEAAANELRSRTSTNLYDARRRWLADAHAALDAAVAGACGWGAGITEDEALRKVAGVQCGADDVGQSIREEKDDNRGTGLRSPID